MRFQDVSTDLWLFIHSVLAQVFFCQVPPVLRHVNTSSTDVSCLMSASFPDSSECNRAGPGERTKKKPERERERKEGWRDWAASQLFQMDEMEKILKIKKEVAVSGQKAGKPTFISWNIESLTEWNSALDGSVDSQRSHTAHLFSTLCFNVQTYLSSTLQVLYL